MKYSTLFSLATAIPAVQGIAFAGPAPTAANPEDVPKGISPVPTKAPSSSLLKKRQNGFIEQMCGWVDGDLESALTCSIGRTCIAYRSASSVGMVGCCSGNDKRNCGWANSCVDYSRYTAGGCGSNCLSNPFVRKCSNSAAPYCVTWTYPGNGLADYGCSAVSPTGVSTVLMTATDTVSRITSSLRFATVSAAALVGLDSATSSGTSNGSSTSSYVKKGLSIGAIVGIVIAVLAILFFVAIGAFMLFKKKKKQKQLAENAQLVAANQANRPQSQFFPPPHPQNMEQSQPFLPQNMNQQPMPGNYGPPQPMPGQAPYAQPLPGQYYAPQGNEQKPDPHASVTEYAMSPISNPPTPAPMFNNQQPYPGPNTQPMPYQQQSQQPLSPPQQGQQAASPVQQYQVPNRVPVAGAHEVDATSVPHAPNQPAGQPVYEIGQGR